MEAPARLASRSFINFVNQTGSPFHSVAEARRVLEDAAFLRLEDTRESWQKVERGGKYYVTRNYSTIMSFIVGRQFSPDQGGFIIAGSHTDSPCLRVRPKSDIKSEGYRLLGVETYGGGLWHTWFDRGLGVAGKVVIRKPNGGVEERLVRIPRPLVIIPSLAIHLQTQEERQSVKINTENHLRPVACLDEATQTSVEPLRELLARETKSLVADILDVDLCLMDATEARICGIDEEFVESARIDNLSSFWAGISAISEISDEEIINSRDILVSVGWDHEEVGSRSFLGADSVTFGRWCNEIVTKLTGDSSMNEIFARSFLLSTDSAHGVHPNYPDKHQALHKPRFGQGVVLKENANQRYASISASMALARAVVSHSGGSQALPCPIQDFVIRNDSPCGSTIGPLCSSQLGLRAIDCGIPQWAMHSCREVCGAQDLLHLKNFILAFFRHFREVDSKSTFLDSENSVDS